MLTVKQKRILIRIAVRLLILAVLLVLIIGQYKSIHNLKIENKAISERVTALENKSVQLPSTVAESEEPTLFEYIGEWNITGYDAKCEHCCNKSDGITASMTEATVGRTVAMNRNEMKTLGIEYGDVIYIDGIGERVVEDTGCGEGVIDVVCKSHEECYKITGTYNVFRKE